MRGSLGEDRSKTELGGGGILIYNRRPSVLRNLIRPINTSFGGIAVLLDYHVNDVLLLVGVTGRYPRIAFRALRRPSRPDVGLLRSLDVDALLLEELRVLHLLSKELSIPVVLLLAQRLLQVDGADLCKLVSQLSFILVLQLPGFSWLGIIVVVRSIPHGLNLLHVLLHPLLAIAMGLREATA
uniref:Uncharacterized protein n=1 Tax=Strombidium inclinatum TaxID=197538 RepID=A0A7S3ITX6_9SPIT